MAFIRRVLFISIFDFTCWPIHRMSAINRQDIENSLYKIKIFYPVHAHMHDNRNGNSTNDTNMHEKNPTLTHTRAITIDKND